jgi:uncharacterized membrane protein
MRGASRFVKAVFLLAAAVWLGGIVAMIIALPSLFGSDEVTRTQAAHLAGAILAQLDVITLILLPVLLVSGLVLMRPAGITRRTKIVMVALMLILAASKLTGFVLLTSMEKLQTRIASFEKSDPMTPERERFNRLHKTAEGLMTLNLVVLVILIVIASNGLTATRRDEYLLNET